MANPDRKRTNEAMREAMGMVDAMARDDMDAFWTLWHGSEDADVVVISLTRVLFQFVEAHGRSSGQTPSEVIAVLVDQSAKRPDV